MLSLSSLFVLFGQRGSARSSCALFFREEERWSPPTSAFERCCITACGVTCDAWCGLLSCSPLVSQSAYDKPFDLYGTSGSAFAFWILPKEKSAKFGSRLKSKTSLIWAPFHLVSGDDAISYGLLHFHSSCSRAVRRARKENFTDGPEEEASLPANPNTRSTSSVRRESCSSSFSRDRLLFLLDRSQLSIESVVRGLPTLNVMSHL